MSSQAGPPAGLYERRLAARALQLVLRQLELGEAMVLKLNPDDPDQVFPGHEEGQVNFYEDRNTRGGARPVAEVFLESERALVVIERLEDLIRRNHRGEFEPRDFGIVQQQGQADVRVSVDLTDVIGEEGELLRSAPPRVLPPRARPWRIPDVVLSRGRG